MMIEKLQPKKFTCKYTGKYCYNWAYQNSINRIRERKQMRHSFTIRCRKCETRKAMDIRGFLIGFDDNSH